VVFVDEVEPGWEVSCVELGGEGRTGRLVKLCADLLLLMWELEIYAPWVISILISGDSRFGITVSSSSAIRALSMDSVDLKSK